MRAYLVDLVQQHLGRDVTLETYADGVFAVLKAAGIPARIKLPTERHYSHGYLVLSPPNRGPIDPQKVAGCADLIGTSVDTLVRLYKKAGPKFTAEAKERIASVFGVDSTTLWMIHGTLTTVSLGGWVGGPVGPGASLEDERLKEVFLRAVEKSLRRSGARPNYPSTGLGPEQKRRNMYQANLRCSHCGDIVAALTQESFDRAVGRPCDVPIWCDGRVLGGSGNERGACEKCGARQYGKKCDRRVGSCPGVYLDTRGQAGVPTTFPPRLDPEEQNLLLIEMDRVIRGEQPPMPPVSLQNNPREQRFVVRSVKQGLALIRHPAITENFEKALRWKPRNKLAVLVPCAGTKPFPEAPSHRDGYLAALEGKDADLWVVSEPLGVVPYEWSRDFPNANYDYPPKFLRDEAWDELAERVAVWLRKVAPKYRKVFVALPGHHERLIRAALEIHNPGNLRDATHSQCLESGACPSGHGRATSRKYRRYLGAVVKNPHDESTRAAQIAAEASPVDFHAVYRYGQSALRGGAGSHIQRAHELVHEAYRSLYWVEPTEPFDAVPYRNELRELLNRLEERISGRAGVYGVPYGGKPKPGEQTDSPFALRDIMDPGWRGSPGGTDHARRNSDESLRNLERAAASGDRSAAVRLDLERHRHGEPSVIGRILRDWLWFDVGFAPDHNPGAGILASRERRRQEEEIDAIGRRILGVQYWSWASDNDARVRGSRRASVTHGEIETALDGPYALHVAYRDNRVRSEWQTNMDRLGLALETEGYPVYWVERDGVVRDAFVRLDGQAIELARDLSDHYSEIVRKARARQRLHDKEFAEIEDALARGEIPEPEALRLHEERVRTDRLTGRERWLMRRIDTQTGGLQALDAMRVARLMGSVERDPWGRNPSERMEEIAAILGSDRGVDAFDAQDEEGAPKYVYVAWEDWEKPTLFWGFDNNRFTAMTTNAAYQVVHRGRA